jgi:hypothetical protein
VAYWFTSLAREIVTSDARADQCARPDKQKATIGGETMNKFLLAWIMILAHVMLSGLASITPFMYRQPARM